MRGARQAWCCALVLIAAAAALFLSLGAGGPTLRFGGASVRRRADKRVLGAAAPTPSLPVAAALPTELTAASAASAASSAAPAAPSFSAADAPTLVYVLLGAPRFQHHVLESLRQSRLLNPRLRIVLVADEAMLYAQRPTWPALLRGPGLRVQLVNASGALLETDLVASFRARYTQLWQELLTFKLREGMLPSVQDERGEAMQNTDFTRVTAERLFVLHSLMQAYGLRNVVHVENDQMLYGRGGVALAVAAIGGTCGLRLAMTRIGKRLSPAVLFARDADALRDMLDFVMDAISHG